MIESGETGRRLSSVMTLPLKVGMPALAAGVVAAMASATALTPLVRVTGFALALVALGAFLAVHGRFQSVRLMGGRLIVSNGLRRRSVPVAEIESVEELKWSRPSRIRIRVRGESITFPPRATWPRVRGEHPVVEELREAMRVHGASAPGRSPEPGARR